MKVRFSKVAALLLSGVAFLAVGCTDYQSDIADIYQKIDELAPKTEVADLRSQVTVLQNVLNELKSTHDKDIAALRTSVAALEEADRGFASKIGALETGVEALKTDLAGTKTTLSELSAAFNTYKGEVNATLAALGQKDIELGNKIDQVKESLEAKIAAAEAAIAAEKKAREDADKALGVDILKAVSDNKTNVADAKAAVYAALGDKAAAAKKADKDLQDAITAEGEARAAAVEAASGEDLAAAVAAESAAREAQEAVLAAANASKKVARQIADSLFYIAVGSPAPAATKLAVEAEVVARSQAELAQDMYTKSIEAGLKDLKQSYEAFVAEARGEIASLKTRVSAAEEAIEGIQAKIATIEGQIVALQQADEKLAQDIKDGDKYVLDSLNVVKAATERSIAALQSAVDAIVAVNVQQSDSLKQAFEKFNDYVLTTTFQTYVDETAALIATKADTAKVNAIQKTVDDHALRIVALEEYKTALVENIIPGLEAADARLKAGLDSLCAVVADVKEDVDSLLVWKEEVDATLAQHTQQIADLTTRVGALEEWKEEADAKINSLLARIQSVEFVPDYSDNYATIEYAALLALGSDIDSIGLFATSSLSKITYKVSPASKADSLVKYLKATDLSNVSFEVVRVKGSATRWAEGDEVAAPALEIVDVALSDRTAGAVEFTVLPKNVDDYNYWALGHLPMTLLGGLEGYLATGSMAENLAKYFGNRRFDNILDAYTWLFPDMPEEQPFYSSCLVINNEQFGIENLSSEFNVWAPKTNLIALEGFRKGGEKLANDRYCESVEYTNTDPYSLAEGLELYGVDVVFSQSNHIDARPKPISEIEAKYGVKFPLVYFAEREMAEAVPGHEGQEGHQYTDDTEFHDLPHDMSKYFVLDNPQVHYPFVANAVSGQSELVPLVSQLNEKVDVALRKNAIDWADYVCYYVAIDVQNNPFAQGPGLSWLDADFDTYLHVTKVKANAVLQPINIEWTYALDVEQDAVAFNNGGTPGNPCYTRAKLPLARGANNFVEKGIAISDFAGASSKVLSYQLWEKASATATDSVKVAEFIRESSDNFENVVVKLELNEAKDTVLLDIEDFNWNKVYVAKVVYDLDAAEVTVTGTINTIDRYRDPITLDYGVKEIPISINLDDNVLLCQTFGQEGEDHTGDDFFMGTLDIYEALAAIDNYNLPTAEEFAQETEAFMGNKMSFVGNANVTTPTLAAPYKYTDCSFDMGACNVVFAPVKFEDFKSVDDTLVVNYKYFTFYGQEIQVKGKIGVTAPKLDFRHNEFRVFDNGTTDAESHPTSKVKVAGRFYSNVEPAYLNGANERGNKWNTFAKFDVVAINLPEAFVVVDNDLKKVDVDTVPGLHVMFSIPGEAQLESNTDDRDNTYVTIEEGKYLLYHGYEEKVRVYGQMYLSKTNTSAHKFFFKTSFDEGFKAIYADKLAADDLPQVGRYAEYDVVKFNPLHDFKSKDDVTIQLLSADVYSEDVLKHLSLKDERRYDVKDPNTLSQDFCEEGIELFAGANWVIGTGANGYATDVHANVAYDIAENYKITLADNEIPEDIKSAIKLVGADATAGTTTNVAPSVVFDYTQEIVLTKPVVVFVDAELTQPWLKDPMTARVTVTIKK